MRTWTPKFTRKWASALTAVALATPLAALSVAPGVTAVPAAQAATAYPPGGPDQTPVMGISGWSFLRLGADAAQIEGQASALVSTGLAAAGYRYVNIDDGWYQCPGPQGPNVDAYGRWVVNTTNYPNVGSQNGIQALAAYVHGLGLKFGIYMTPGISSQAVAQNTPILGTSYTADDIATTTAQNNYNCGGMVGINYNAPGAQAYTDSVVDELASWGVDYIKLDGITNKNTADVEAWQAAIQQSGRPMVLNITQGSYTIKLAPTLKEYANQWEFAPDIEINGPDEGSADACNAPPYTGCLSVFPLTSYAHWDDRFADVAQWQPYGGPGGFNDYDSIEVGDGSADSGMSLAASETQLSLWSLGSAPLILGGDLSTSVTNAYGTSAGLTTRDFNLLTNPQVIKVDQDAIDASQIAITGTPGSKPGDQVFAKIEPCGDAVVGLFNTTTKLSSNPVSISTTAAAIGLPADPAGYLVQDLWGGQSVVVGGQSTFDISSAGTISATVPAEGVALYRVTPLP
ncbi:MAG TPA: glycoside hydrolase family 27 protein [Streptosporangiaceae bacterium]|nr:glycoside hydrolase family 27 protein [Streptosporangiaceae bacterium]